MTLSQDTIVLRDRTHYAFCYQAEGKSSVAGGRQVDRILLFSDSIIPQSKNQQFDFILNTDDTATHGGYTLSGTFKRQSALHADPCLYYSRGREQFWELGIALDRTATHLTILSFTQHPLAKSDIPARYTLREIRLPTLLAQENRQLLSQALADKISKERSEPRHVSPLWPHGL